MGHVDVAGVHFELPDGRVLLEDVSFRVGDGAKVALVGANGAGKTTLLRTISGLLPASDGSIRLDGREVRGSDARDMVRAGVAHIIEGHRVFTQLSVTDNLLLAGYYVPRAERAARIEEALDYFPEIGAKRHEKGAALSGGQQQMLAVAQGLVQRPRLLMLDEPSAGLSPVLVDRVLNVLGRLAQAGTAVLLVEQLVEKALAAANRVYALAQGRVVFEAPTSAPNITAQLERAYLGGKG